MSKITITDVARTAGVSVSTVSRVLNDEKYVKPEKKNAVLEAVRFLNYQPNLYARSLGGEKSFLVGLLFDDPSGGYLSDMQRGAMKACQKTGHHLVVELFNKDNKEGIDRFLDTLSLQGIILAPPVCDNLDVLEAVKQRNIPIVRISPGSDCEGTVSIGIDNYKAAALLVNYLISLGHSKIGFIKGDPDHADAVERERAYLDTMKKHGLKVNPEWSKVGTYTFESGLNCAVGILSNPHRPTAIFASNDEMAASVITIANKFDIRIPEELSVVGFDDLAVATLISPSLTTIHQPVEKMAELAVEHIVEISKSNIEENFEPVILESEFMMRRSTAGPSK